MPMRDTWYRQQEAGGNYCSTANNDIVPDYVHIVELLKHESHDKWYEPGADYRDYRHHPK